MLGFVLAHSYLESAGSFWVLLLEDRSRTVFRANPMHHFGRVLSTMLKSFHSGWRKHAASAGICVNSKRCSASCFVGFFLQPHVVLHTCTDQHSVKDCRFPGLARPLCSGMRLTWGYPCALKSSRDWVPQTSGSGEGQMRRGNGI